MSYGDGPFYGEVPYCTEKYPILRRDYRSTEKLHTVRQWPYWATVPGNTAQGAFIRERENGLPFRKRVRIQNEFTFQK